MKRIDTIFGLQTPVLFAHRGGALEAPESTIKGFRHAIQNANTDVLEFDVQLTRDGQFVVWHGPELHNVRIQGQSDRPKERRRTKIYHYDWRELEGKAWVADPDILSTPVHDRNLSTVPADKDRCLMLLVDFLTLFPDHPLNIEMKKSFERKINDIDRKGLKHNIKTFLDILDRGVDGIMTDRPESVRKIMDQWPQG